MQRVLKPGGALVLWAARFHPEQVRRLSATLRQTFAQVACYGVYVPLYGAYWGMAVCSDTLQPASVGAGTIAQRLAERGVGDLQYYNADIHGALFALPNYYRQLLRIDLYQGVVLRYTCPPCLFTTRVSRFVPTGEPGLA